MRRNFIARRGTVISRPDFDAWLTSTYLRRGKTGFRAFDTDLFTARVLAVDDGDRPERRLDAVHRQRHHAPQGGRALRQDRDFALKAAHTDELTGVATAGSYTLAWTKCCCGRLNANGVLGCIGVIDLDNFKYVNDRFGHQAGDIILRDFAATILRHLRRADCFGRVGGEEFMLVLPDTTVATAVLIVERMLGFDPPVAAAEGQGRCRLYVLRGHCVRPSRRRCGQPLRARRQGAMRRSLPVATASCRVAHGPTMQSRLTRAADLAAVAHRLKEKPAGSLRRGFLFQRRA